MSTTVEFQGHETFHQSSRRVIIAGALTASVVHFIPAMDGPWRLAAVAAAALIAGSWTELRQRKLGLPLALVMAAVGAALLAIGSAQAIYGFKQAGTAFLGAVLAGAGIASFGLRRRRLMVGLLITSATLVLGAYVFAKFSAAQELAALPSWLTAVLAGAAFSTVSIAALLPRHLVLVTEPVVDSYKTIAAAAKGEVRDLVERGYDVWQKAEANLARDDANRGLLEEAVLRLFDVAGRWNAVEAEGAQNQAESLAARMDELDKRIAGASDDVVKKQYEHAREALAEQLRYIKDISTSRERVLARMHNYLAAMERLRLAVVNFKSANASRDAVDVQPMVDTLAEIGRDIDTLGASLDP